MIFFHFLVFGSSLSEKLSVVAASIVFKKMPDSFLGNLTSAFYLAGDEELLDHPERAAAWISYVERAPFNLRTFNHWRFRSEKYIFDNVSTKEDWDYDNLTTNLASLFSTVKYKNGLRSWPYAFQMKTFMGLFMDLYSPLHSVELFSSQFPYGDKNGRLFDVVLNGKNISLYELWETGCGLTTLTSKYNSNFWKEVDVFADELMKGREFNDKVPCEIFDIIERHDNNIIYGKHEIYDKTTVGQDISEDYVNKCQEYTKNSTVMAAQRLYTFLNSLDPVVYQANYTYNKSSKSLDGDPFVHEKVLETGILAYTFLCILAPFTLLLIWKKHFGQ